MNIIVFAEEITPRIEYIFERFFTYFFSADLQFTSSEEEFIQSNSIKLNYSLNDFENCITFRPNGLLSENGIKHTIIPDMELYNGLPQIFICPEGGELPFDPFSAAFFLISRYEEYLSFNADKHGRFEAHNSFLYGTPFISIPLADHYALMTGEILSSRTGISFENKQKYVFTPTIDIDVAYAYKGRGFGRTMGGMLKSLSRLQLGDISNRLSVLMNKKDDPFDTYLLMRRIHKNLITAPIFFINVGDYSAFDKNIPFYKSLLPTLIGKLAQYGGIGLHPSYFSNDEPDYLEEELYRLERITGWKVKRSRQHFLRLYLPETYDDLIKNGIEEDYTMGYAEQPGFRAGTCHPFMFFNLKTNSITKLKIMPFVIMDGTFRDYLNLSPDKSIEIINNLINEVKKVNGHFISLWHNESLSEFKRWQGWSMVYDNILEKAGIRNDD